MRTGSCACGTIQFETEGQPEQASVCHCSQCRKMSGYAWASAQLPLDQVKITGPLRWISLTPQARRGICPDCGSFLFWHGTDEPLISVALGAIDGPTGITLEKHIFTADRGDYYLLTDGLPHRP